MRAIFNVIGVALASGALVSVAATWPEARRMVIPAIAASGSPCGNPAACGAPAPAVTNKMAQRIEGRPRLLVFSSKSCPACKRMEPVLATALKACGGENDAFRVDFDDDAGEALAARYGVTLLPSFVSVDAHGFEVARLTGVQPEASIERAVAEVRGARCARAPLPAGERTL